MGGRTPHLQNYLPSFFSGVNSRILILTYNIQGTFFVIGSQLKAHPDLWQQAVADGHQICNHTYTHTCLSSLWDTLYLEQTVKGLIAKGLAPTSVSNVLD